LRKGHSFSLGLHTTVSQTEIYAIKACIVENIEKEYIGRKIYILSDSQEAIKALDSFQINSKLVWDCHQSNSPECNRCKQASETASHILCDCEALATLRFRHLGRHFMKPGDFEDISVRNILHFVEGAGLLNELKGCTKD
jgi:hypothetical protein